MVFVPIIFNLCQTFPLFAKPKNVYWEGHSQATDMPATSQGTAGQVTGHGNNSDEITAQSVVPSL